MVKQGGFDSKATNKIKICVKLHTQDIIMLASLLTDPDPPIYLVTLLDEIKYLMFDE